MALALPVAEGENYRRCRFCGRKYIKRRGSGTRGRKKKKSEVVATQAKRKGGG